MKRIARSLNLSDTVFVLLAGELGYAARLRIFTLARGHFPSVSHATMRLNAGATCQR
ncbi:MAG TPA: hypothetical protein VHB50_07325 [Bryobacteraceae bacterium]|nr:hypothetical protein [Bryobacteraceae bacterium]